MSKQPALLLWRRTGEWSQALEVDNELELHPFSFARANR